MEKLRVFKSSGTSVGNGECICHVVRMVKAASQPTDPGIPSPPLPTKDHLAYLEQANCRLLPVQKTFARWQRAGGSAPSQELVLRERLLGPATLSSASLRLLYDIPRSSLIICRSASAGMHRPSALRNPGRPATAGAGAENGLGGDGWAVVALDWYRGL